LISNPEEKVCGAPLLSSMQESPSLSVCDCAAVEKLALKFQNF
jgi:hypothetical protein